MRPMVRLALRSPLEVMKGHLQHGHDGRSTVVDDNDDSDSEPTPYDNHDNDPKKDVGLRLLIRPQQSS
jgi:hypothetical protein